MYGADPARSQAQLQARGPATVSRRLVARARHADRVPRGRPGRRGLHRERARDRPRARHAQRRRHLEARHAAREDGGIARGLGRRARRPRHGRARVGAAALRRAPPLALHGRLARRVVAGDRRRSRRLRRLERHDHRARPAHAPCPLAVRGRLQGDVLGRARGHDALPRRLLRPPGRAAGAHRASSLRARRGRPGLRHAGRVGGARLRAELDGGLADGVLDERPLPLAPLDRLVRLLLAGRRRRAGLLRLLQRRLLRPLGADRPDTLGARDRRPDLRRRGRRRRGRLRRLVRAPHRRGRCAGAGASCSTSRTASTCRCPAPAGAFCCTATRGSMRSCGGETPADRDRRGRRSRADRRRSGLLPARQAAGARHRRVLDDRVRHDRGRSTAAARARDRLADLRPRRPAPALRERRAARTPVPNRVDLPGAEPRRVSARGRLRPPVLREQRGRRLRDRCEERKARVEVRLASLRRRLAGARPSRRLRGVPQRAAVQPEAERGAHRRGRRVRGRDGSRPLAAHDRPVRVVAGRRRRVGLRRRLGRPHLGAAPPHGEAPLGDDAALAGEERCRDLGQPPVRRRLLGPSLLAEREEREDRLAVERAAAVRQHRQLLCDAGARLRTGLRRRDRRQDVLVRRSERQAALVAVDRGIRLFVGRGVALPDLRRLLLPHVLLLQRGDR